MHHPAVLRHLLPGLLAPRRRRLWRLTLALLLAVISWLAFKPAVPAQEWLHMDKLRHISAFLTLAVVASLGWAKQAQLAPRVAFGLLAYGLLIELVQSQLPSRSASLADWAADALGIALGLVLARWLRSHS